MNEKAIARVGPQLKKKSHLHLLKNNRRKANQRAGIPRYFTNFKMQRASSETDIRFFCKLFTTAAHWIPSFSRVNRAQGLTLLPLLRFILTISSLTKLAITDISTPMHASLTHIFLHFIRPRALDDKQIYFMVLNSNGC